jgi:hypothetical protein
MIDHRDEHKESLFLTYAKKLMKRAKSIGYQSPYVWRNLASLKTFGPVWLTRRISA